MGISVTDIGDAEAHEWDEFVESRPSASIYHQYRWRGFFSDYFRKETRYLVARENRVIVGVLPLVRSKSMLFGDYIVSLPFLNYGGILSVGPEARNALFDTMGHIACELGVSHVELRETESIQDVPTKSHKVAMLLDLPDTEEALSKQLGSKLRSQIRRSDREGATVCIGGGELVPQFYKVFSRNMRDLGTPVYGQSMFKDLAHRFADSTRIVVVLLHDKPVAAGFVIRDKGRAEIPWASSDRRYNRFAVNMKLYWEVLKYCIASECDLFDFGRSTRDSGTYHFKKQWGAKPVPLHWNYWLAPNESVPELNPENSRFELAISLWQRLPVVVTTKIGPMLARNLP